MQVSYTHVLQWLQEAVCGTFEDDAIQLRRKLIHISTGPITTTVIFLFCNRKRILVYRGGGYVDKSASYEEV